MTAERWHKVRDILYAASQLELGARCGYLNEACSGDSGLRAEVEKLLLALDRSGEFLEPEPSVTSAGSRALRIGPYLVLDEAGHGGMGVVYHAVRDDDYRQEVAIKLVKAGAETDFLIGRFRLERQALAMLDHPNIARLLDGGTTPDGRPYLVMEWVKGQPITEHCRAHALSLEERLKLFLDVGDAVEHAHRNLVVHRDLKPSNILITAEGRPKLLDFGIAKIFSNEASDEPVTLGARLLTPDYASPEQVRGEAVTTVTDVYSLGVVLYEILTGSRPLQFDTRTPAEIERMVCTHEPPPPSAVTATAGIPARELRGDLDNVVLKAMQKEPHRRYGSVNQFCEDIRRHVAGLPVGARKDTFWYRARKFVQRHRAGVAATALVFAAMAAGTATTLWQARVAVRERGRAERRFNDVRKLANSFLFEFYDAIRDLPGSTPARSLLVKRALEYLDSLAGESRQDPSLQREMATAYEKVGEVQGDPMFPNLGDSRGALATFSKALAIRESLSAADPGNHSLKRELADTYESISDILAFSGDTAGAVRDSGTALKIYESLADHFSNDSRFQYDLAGATYTHAGLLRKSGNLDGSLTEYTRAAELSRRLIAAQPSLPEGKMHLATSIDGVGGILQEKGDTRGALENRRKALAIREDLVSQSPNSSHYRRQLGFAHHNLGLSLAEAGDFDLALAQFREELRLFESLAAADPTDAQARRNLSLAHKQIGDVLVKTSDWTAAREQYAKAVAMDRASTAADPASAQARLDLSLSEGKYGFVVAKLGNAREALAIMRKAVTSQELLLARDPGYDLIRGFLANSYTRLAQVVLESGDTTGALDYYRKALTARQNLFSENPGNTANLGALAECYMNLGQAVAPGNPAEALEFQRQAIKLLESLTAADPNNAQHRLRLANAITNAARLHVRLAARKGEPPRFQFEQWSEARSLYHRSRDLWLALEHGGKLVPSDRRWPVVVTRELAGCEALLAGFRKE